MSATTVILPGHLPLEFPGGLDYEIKHAVLTIKTESGTRHYAPSAWFEVRDS